MLKIIGAGYLFYLGYKLWVSDIVVEIEQNTNNTNKSAWVLFQEAFIVTLTNPKALVFISALLPQFISVNNELFLQIIIFGGTIALIQFGALTAYALLASGARGLLGTPKIHRIFNKFAGICFMGLAMALGLSEPQK